ncbi:MAG: cytochrome c oxidase cbb3-type subunit [Sulfurospirillum sp.]|jgi:cytochrome c oxidase cbb3-type subunit 4|nr:cytochrome c oxidase cbb3-type subunit [Sulfurospirillum sp.]DAB31858.1 MAG TPA: cytochrome c oxidase, cbb3-type, CcoQ subunit [Sulfurospirillum sp. UBA11407]DAB34526.1 MAG TPA: cytochrome c oxidase, cbb3-type, CcoQ subunit [Sulfurospirillum sp. UBA12182]
METIRELQAYGYFFFTVFLVLILYGYVYHLYKSEKIGRRNYEKYADIALNDDITDAPVEKIEPIEEQKQKEEQ